MRVVLSLKLEWLVIDETDLIIEKFDSANKAYDFLRAYYGEE